MIEAIEREDYCTDILTQSLAIQRALRSLNKLIAEHHIDTHIAHGLRSRDPDKVQQAKNELLDIYELSNVRGK